VTGWALFLDYLIVIALAALFLPHYLGNAVGWEAITDEPWDVAAAVAVILTVAAVRLVRRPKLYTLAVAIAVVALGAHLVLVVLGLPHLSFEALDRGTESGVGPSWENIAFALPLAMLAYTGLETVANLAAETREPGRTLPRSLFAGIGAVVVMSVAVAAVGVSAVPDLGTTWRLAPLAGIADAVGGDLLRVVIGLSGVLVLLAAVTTSMSGAGRLSYSMARYGMLPHAFERLNRRTLLSPAAIAATALVPAGLLIGANLAGSPSLILASLFSFGVLLAFTAAQLAVVRLRSTEPELHRPFRAPGMPLVGLLGAALTAGIWVLAMVTHEAARYVGPIWLAVGLLIFVGVRRSRGDKVLERFVPPVADIVASEEGEYRRILVPLKLGPIGDEVLATAIRLAEERDATITALHVIRVPLEHPLDEPLYEAEEHAESSLAEAKLLASEHGVTVEGEIVRARSIGAAIVEAANRIDADLILLGSAPRWRRQARFFSPTVDHVLRKAPCEIMVVAYPQGVLEEEEATA
jgi:basic amino acid/polyamine antiporter, APA family